MVKEVSSPTTPSTALEVTKSGRSPNGNAIPPSRVLGWTSAHSALGFSRVKGIIYS